MRIIDTKTATTLELLASYVSPITTHEALSEEFVDLLDDVELELIRRDDVPEEYFELIDELQGNWNDC